MKPPRLKPCPCCGGDPIVNKEAGSWGYYPAKFRIKCSVCGLATVFVDDKEELRSVKVISSYDEALRDAAALWNRRTQEEAK